MTIGSEPRARWPRHPASHGDAALGTPPQTVRAQVAVIGSGPGGAVTAAILAESGRDVVVIEEGPFATLESVAPFSLDEMVAKYRNAGVTVAMGPTKVAYVEGRCVGGGSEINSGLYHRTPPEVLDAWRRDFQVDSLSFEDLRPHFEACEHDVSVSCLPGPAPAASLKLHEGATRLGWKSLEVPRWFRYEAGEGGVKAARGSRQSMSRTFVPRALQAGCRLYADTRARRIAKDGNRWIVSAEWRKGEARQPVTIEAETLFVCGGAVQTPALLRRSGLTRNVGNSLRMHPTVKVIARFADEVNAADMEVPVHQVKEFAPRFSFGCSISSPPHLALGMSDHPGRLGDVNRGWRNMAVYYAMITGNGSGSVRGVPGFRDSLVRYRVTQEDLADLSLSLRQLCRLLFEAGAVALYPSVSGAALLHSEADLQQLPARLPRSRTSLMTIHLFSSCPMGENQKVCAVDSFGRVHGHDGLYIADASLLCSPPSVNPQGSIMAIARRNALRFLERAS